MKLQETENDTASFTSWKLDILDAMSCDKSLLDIDMRVAFRLMQHVNAKTRDAHPSLERLAAQIGVSRDTVMRSLKRMTDPKGGCLWLSRSRRDRTFPYTYSFVTDRLNQVLDGKIDREDRAREAVKTRRKNQFEVARLQPREVANDTGLEVANDTDFEVAPVQPKHLKNNYLNRTPINNSSEGREVLHRPSLDKSSASFNDSFPKPRSSEEANKLLDRHCEGYSVSPYMRIQLMNMLMVGILSPRMINNILNPAKQDVA